MYLRSLGQGELKNRGSIPECLASQDSSNTSSYEWHKPNSNLLKQWVFEYMYFFHIYGKSRVMPDWISHD